MKARSRRPFTWMHLIGLNVGLLALLLALLPEGDLAQEAQAENLVTQFGAIAYHGDHGEVISVDCSNQPINNWMLSVLPRFRHLEILDLWNANGFDDAGLAHLAKLKNLRELNLVNTPITDAGVAHLARLSRLEVLTLSGTEITDDALRQIRHLKNLRTLILEDTEITDSGLAFLAGLPRLEVVLLYRTLVTESGISRLKAALPHSLVVAT